MQLRQFTENDTGPLLQLAHETIRTVNSTDYTEEQCDAWIAGMDEEKYRVRLAGSHTLIAEEGDCIAGFINLESDGHVDNIYVRNTYRSKGVGSLLLEAAEEKAKHDGLKLLNAEVSITAKHFFESHGFRVVEVQDSPYRGQVFRRFKMEKAIS